MTGPDEPPTTRIRALVPRIEQTGAIPIAAPPPARRRRRPRKRLRVDWPNCKAHGLCHELVPELIGLDEWGYPLLLADDVRSGLQDDAKRAVAACPTLALRLIDPPT